MADGTQVNGYWGSITSAIEWCENNYAVAPYLVEFYNTISNIPGIILSLIGLINSIRQRFEKRFSFLHLSTMALGFGSILFHATMQNIQQQSEETPMVWMILMYIYVLYSPDWHYTSTMPTVLFIYGTLFAALHSWFRFVLIFQVHCVFLSLLCLPRMYKYYIHTTDPHAKRLAHMYILTVILGGFCWVLDWTFCSRMSTWAINPHGHAWWHLFRGFSSYFANTFFQFCRAQQCDWNPELRWFWGLPYVKISKPKRE
eukprot:c26923_g2_i2 orf=137-907(-)